MRKFRIFSGVLSLFLLVPASIIWAQSISQQKGLTTLVFPTQHGTVKIYLPDDIRPGDLISGTIIAEPGGNNERQRVKNLAELAKYNISVDGTQYAAGDKPAVFTWLVHPDRQGFLPVEMIQEGSTELLSLNIPVKPAGNNTTATPGCHISSHALTASPFRVLGSFDGDLSNTRCKINDQPIVILAESPRQCIVDIPSDAGGPHTFSITENNREKCSATVSGVDMSVTTGKLTLQKGEQTSLNVKISGLRQLPAIAVLTVNNLSTAVVNMLPANDVIIPLLPEKVAEGNFEQRFEISSFRAGTYSVKVDLQLPDGPPVFSDVPGENDNAKKDPVPCPENSLAEQQSVLESLRSELAGMDAAIAKAKADTAACGRKKREKNAAAAAANEEFKKQEQRKKNWDKSGKETPKNVTDDYTNAKNKKDKADKEAAGQALKCDEAAKKLDDLENRKRALPHEIKKQEEKVEVLKTEVEKCKLEAEEKKKKAEADKKKSEEEAAAASRAEAAAKEAQRQSVVHQRYLLQNIYSLGLISSKEFWEVKGLWDWLPETLSKPVGDYLEDKGNPSPIPIDIIPALAGLFQLFGKMLDPCSPDGARKTVERLGGMINTKTNAKYTEEEALTKTEQMCELLKKLKNLSGSAGGK